MRRLPLLLALLAALALPTAAVLAQDGAGDPGEAQLVVISALPDRAAGSLVVRGLDFGVETPRVTLGVEDLEVLYHDVGRIEASLPPEVPAGSYLLIVARGPALHEYDVFHLAVPALPAAPAEPPRPTIAAAGVAGQRGPAGAAGPPGPPGPPGPSGPAGPSVRAELAGLRCPPGSFLAGFDAAGALICEPAPAAAVLPPEAPGLPGGVVGGEPAVPGPGPRACTGDLAASGAELADAWGPRVEALAAYPEAREGLLEGTFASATDRDLLAITAREAEDRLCMTHRQDRPLRATLELSAPAEAGATLCACWSRPGAPCSLSPNRCVPAAAGGSAELALPMTMVCGARDEGVLELEVRAAGAAACDPWSLRWAISE